MQSEDTEQIKNKTQTQPMVHLRPHHGLCLQNFRGKGYSDGFSQNMAAMQKRLFENPQIMVCITEGADELCQNCPNRRGKGCTSAHPALYDQNVLNETGIRYGQELSWREFRDTAGPLSLYELDATCPGCQWLSLCKEIAADRMKAAAAPAADR